MKRLWSTDELTSQWALSADDMRLAVDHGEQAKLGLMCQLAFWREHARFPDVEADIAPAVVERLARQIDVSADVIDGYDFAGRSGRRHRRMVLDHLAVREFDEAAEAAFRAWLLTDCLPQEPALLALEEAIAGWFARERAVRPGRHRLDRIVRSTRVAHDDAVLATIAGRLDGAMRERLDALLTDDGSGAAYTRLSAGPGKVGLDSLLAEIDELEVARGVGLPRDLLSGIHADTAKRLRRRAAVESAWQLRRHPTRIRLPLLAAWAGPREAEIVDGLVELLIQVTHRITVKAERRVAAELIEEARTVRGKAGILFKVASAVTERPDGMVRQVTFPVVDERTFRALAEEAIAAGTAPARRVHTAVRASYGPYYRRMMPKLLAGPRLPFEQRLASAAHRCLGACACRRGRGPAILLLRRGADDGVVRPEWRDIVIEKAPDGGGRVNRISYEIASFRRCATSSGARRCGWWALVASATPTRTCRADYAERRAGCYERLGLPADAQAFSAGIKGDMKGALTGLDRTMPRNPQVRLKPRRQHPISVTPLEPQPVPPSLEAVR